MTQRDIVLRELRAAGPQGVTARDFVYLFGITRSAAIVWTLRHEEGLDIETIDEGGLSDGRHKMARYILRGVQPQPILRPRTPESFIVPAALNFSCGCVREADGRSWRTRCARHGPAVAQ